MISRMIMDPIWNDDIEIIPSKIERCYFIGVLLVRFSELLNSSLYVHDNLSNFSHIGIVQVFI